MLSSRRELEKKKTEIAKRNANEYGWMMMGDYRDANDRHLWSRYFVRIHPCNLSVEEVGHLVSMQHSYWPWIYHRDPRGGRFIEDIQHASWTRLIHHPYHLPWSLIRQPASAKGMILLRPFPMHHYLPLLTILIQKIRCRSHFVGVFQDLALACVSLLALDEHNSPF